MTAGSRPETASSSATDGTVISPVSSTSSHPSSSSHSHKAGKLPAPPPPDRQPAGKGKSAGPGGHQRFKVLGRKGREKRRSVGAVDDDEDWTIAGLNGEVGPAARENIPSHGHDVLISPPSPSRHDQSTRAAQQSLDDSAAALFDSQLTEVPKEKKSKGRGLVKKTSRLFSRDKDKDAIVVPGSSASLAPSKADRQSSYSSNDSAVTTSSAASSRPPSAARNGNNTKSGHLRRLSQDSQFSWHAAAQGSVRSGVSSIREMSGEGKGATGNNLSASVPGLNRHALPQPGPGPSSRGQETIPSRMSSWITNFLPSSTGTAESSSAPAEPQASSPARKGPSAAANFLYAARQKAVDGMRHLLDSEAQPDKSPDTIWVMGVGHPGYRPSTPVESPKSLTGEAPQEAFFQRRRGSNSSGKASPPIKSDQANLRPAVWPKKKDPSQAGSPPPKGFGNTFSTSTLSLALPNATSPPSKEAETRAAQADSPSRGKRKEKEVIRWPEQFHEDFRSRVWCTYRSQYAPIVSLPDRLLVPTPEAYYSSFASPPDVALTSTTSNDLPRPKPAASTSLPNRPSTSPWAWARSGDERGLTSDAGWGCMLRTGQSMLANALVHVHLGRDWRVPFKPVDSTLSKTSVEELEDYATYVRLMSWFLDDPSPLCPFSVHRMALIGKELGKEVGEWFGPSTAAGALKTLANSFSPAGLAVATATDSMIYKSDVYAASSLPSTGWFDEETGSTPSTTTGSGSKRSSSERGRGWGDKAVLILVGLRLGLDGVNPIYYDSIKALFTFPQSVGIAGGRPSSSYFFVASQANSLFYLDPHLTRPAVPLEIPPAPKFRAPPRPRRRRADEADTDADELVVVDSPTKKGSTLGQGKRHGLGVIDLAADDMSDDSGASSPTRRLRRTTARQHPIQPRTTPPGSPTRQAPDTPTTPLAPSPSRSTEHLPESSQPTPTATTRTRSRSIYEDKVGRDPSLEWYATAYSEAQLRTFHCEKVKRIPLSGLDPSMLLGFLCRDEAEFDDFCERAGRLPQKIFTVQDEPPVWDEDDDAGLESVSEPDMEDDERTPSASPPTAHGADEDDVEVLEDDFSTTTQNAIEIETDEQRLAALKTPAVVSAEEDVGMSEKENDKPRPPKPRPLQSIGAIGSDTQSWIRPVSTGQEAPNGRNVL